MKAQEIYQLRLDSGLTLGQISQLVGVTPPTFQRWESGANSPAQVYLAALYKLREKVNAMQGSNYSKDDIAQTIGKFLLAGGIIAFLIWVFRQDD